MVNTPDLFRRMAEAACLSPDDEERDTLRTKCAGIQSSVVSRINGYLQSKIRLP